MSLDIEENTKALVVKALNKYPIQKDAAKALGVNLKTLHQKIKVYNLTAKWTISQ